MSPESPRALWDEVILAILRMQTAFRAEVLNPDIKLYT